MHIRRAMELNPSDEIINLAKEIKSAMGQKALQKESWFVDMVTLEKELRLLSVVLVLLLQLLKLIQFVPYKLLS